MSAERLGGGFDELRRAAVLAGRESDVRVMETALRAGAPFLTESFLTPFRFDLGQSLVRRPGLPGLRLLEPDPLVAVGDATVGRAPVVLEPADTAVETLDASGVAEPGQRTALVALGLALGVDPEARGSGAGLAGLCAVLDDLVVVAGGNGVAAAAAADALVAAGGHLVEGLGSPAVPTPPTGLGLCRTVFRAGGSSGQAVSSARCLARRPCAPRGSRRPARRSRRAARAAGRRRPEP